MPTVWTDGNVYLSIETDDHKPPHAHVRDSKCQTRVNLETLEILRWSKRKRVKTTKKFDKVAIALVRKHLEDCKKVWELVEEAKNEKH